MSVAERKKIIAELVSLIKEVEDSVDGGASTAIKVLKFVTTVPEEYRAEIHRGARDMLERRGYIRGGG